MRRTLVIIGAVILLLFPLVLVAYRNWDAIQEAVFKTKFLSRRTVSPQYAAETKTPGYSIVIVDTAFLEYIAATMRVYDNNAIADPGMYFGNRTSITRHTVLRLKFELVPTLERYLVALGGSQDFAGRGIYAIEDDTLVVRVSLNEEELIKSNGAVQFNLEDMFLDTALQTLVYATGKPGSPISPAELTKVQKAIKENIPSGIFPRPITIETQE